jgi:excisionase family DNA binding protein
MSAYLTIQEVAEQMRCEHRTVRRAINNNELAAAMIGGKWLIRQDEVDAWFDSQCATPARPPAPRRRRKKASAGVSDSVARIRAMEGSRG